MRVDISQIPVLLARPIDFQSQHPDVANKIRRFVSFTMAGDSIFEGTSPLANPISLLLVQILIIVGLSQTLGVGLKYLWQPVVVAEVCLNIYASNVSVGLPRLCLCGVCVGGILECTPLLGGWWIS